MFRVKKETKRVNKTFRISADLLERMQTIAEANDISVNELVCQACEYALKSMRRKKEA